MLQEWEEENRHYHKTSATRSVSDTVKSSNCIMVTGNPGTGKSALMQHVALDLQTHGYDIVPLTKLSHIKKRYTVGALQAFVLNDPFGKRELDMHSVIKWQEDKETLSMCFRKIDDNARDIPNMNCVLLISCSSLVANNRILNEFTSYLHVSTFDLNDDKHKMATGERRLILESYIRRPVIVRDSVLDLHDNFPLICKIFSSNEDFNNNPEPFLLSPCEAYYKEVQNMKLESPYRYCALASFVFFPVISSEQVLNHRNFRERIRPVYTSLELGHTYSDTAMLRAFHEMRSLYTIAINGWFRIAHSVLLDVVGYCLSKDSVEYVIKHACHWFLQNRIRIYDETQPDDADDKFYIYLNRENRHVFIKRMYEEIAEGNFQDVFNNSCMSNDEFQVLLFNMLNAEKKLNSFLSESNQRKLQWEFSQPFSILKQSVLTPCATPLIFWVTANGWKTFFHKYYEFLLKFGKYEEFILYRENLFVLALFSRDIELINSRKCVMYEHILKECICFYCNHSPISQTEAKHTKGCCMDFPLLYVPILLKDRTILKFVKQFMFGPYRKYVDRSDSHSNTSLMLASYIGDCHSVSFLLEHNAGVNAQNDRLKTPLMMSCEQGHNMVINLLIRGNAAVNLIDSFGKSALHYACQYADVSVVDILLRNGANANIRDYTGASPLVEAYRNGKLELINLLLGSNADTSIGPHQTASICKTYENRYDLYLQRLKRSSQHAFPDEVYSNVSNWLSKYYNIVITQEETLLTLASYHGNDDVVKVLLCQESPNTPDKNGDTPLMRACQQNHETTVKLLIARKANVHLKNNENMTALMYACQQENGEIVKLLLSVHADPNTKNMFDETSLLLACKTKRTPIVSLLCQHGLDINVPDCFEQTPLLHACIHGNEDIAFMLLNNGADCNLSDDTKMTPLMKACNRGNVEIVKALLAKGARINSQSGVSGATALMKSCTIGHKDMVSLLLNCGADVNIKKWEGNETALTIACENGGLDICLMMTQSQRATLQNLGHSLLKASANGHYKIVKMLVEMHAAVDTTNSRGDTSLVAALKNRHTEIAYYLITQNADTNTVGFGKLLNQQNSEGMSMLHFACQNRDKDNVKVLISKGADLNLSNVFPSTCLHDATESAELVRLLLQNKADPNVEDDFQATPLHVAIECNFRDSFDVLIDYNANVNVHDDSGMTPLMLASSKNDANFVTRLLLAGADINATDQNGFTSLMKAVSNNCPETVQLLLDHGAYVHSKAMDGTSALSIAKDSGIIDAISRHIRSNQE